jgi:hypothetical protein
MFKTKVGGIIQTVLFIVAAILILSYFGINWEDVKEHGFTQFVISLFNGFFN